MNLPRREFHRTLLTQAAVAAASTIARPTVAAAPSPDPGGKWYSMFDGKTLNGWTPKIRYEEAGDDRNSTFRVAEGMIQLRYDRYGTFDGKFGALFFNEPFSNYSLRFEYRIVGQMCNGGPDWAVRRTGIVIHGEDPRLLHKDRERPIGLQVLLYGGDGTNSRDTACLFAHGARVVHDGKPRTDQYLGTSSKTFHGDQWVTVELEVRGAGAIVHRVNGETVLTYEQPQYDPNEENAKNLIRGDGLLAIEGGTISLASDSHPADFRTIEIMPLD
ncbi:MAG: 3-keto-disaccharide hydrolase [Planctomycetia bacterium]